MKKQTKKLTKSQMEAKLAEYTVILKEILEMGMMSLDKTCGRIEQMAKDDPKTRTPEQQIIYDYNLNYVVAVNNLLHPSWDVIYGLMIMKPGLLDYLKAQRKQAVEMKIVPLNCACTYCEVNS
ncbi:hypothetical protein UFOVP9_36 [uncultured Caudovirales phage]|uniref:Uncharacterized protein n=1 Tax=uncultured Caudovirales phage TaxID=2100421 RepID=A0A6J5KGW7_9CAUD|nr:hypothetical protein UFOVP9_36 [uncultured Caudovirales phage]